MEKPRYKVRDEVITNLTDFRFPENSLGIIGRFDVDGEGVYIDFGEDTEGGYFYYWEEFRLATPLDKLL